MRYIFFLFFLAVVTADVFGVIYATNQSQQPKNNGITLTRAASSAQSYSYLVFTNNNKYDVTITYIIEGCAPTKISVKAGESKKTTSAYNSSSNVETVVEPLYNKIELKTKPTKKKSSKTNLK